MLYLQSKLTALPINCNPVVCMSKTLATCKENLGNILCHVQNSNSKPKHRYEYNKITRNNACSTISKMVG